jgi:GDPmannose 4,6-dehydratase
MKKFANKKILIFGVTGQDGSLLAKEFLNKNYKVYGVLTSNRKNFKNLNRLKILDKLTLIDSSRIKTSKIILNSKCSYIFFFSGLSSVTKSNLYKNLSLNSNNKLLIEILETIRVHKLKKIKVLNASSSEIFGNNRGYNTEDSEINPASYYGLAKSISTEICKAYRLQFGIKVFNAILFNHESPLRPSEYVLQKVISGVKKISLKKEQKLLLGNIDVSRDWGWAPEYVRIMSKLIDIKNPGDFIISTGKNVKLKDVIKNIFLYYKLDYRKYTKISKNLLRPYEIEKISGNNKKLTKEINYKPKILINEIIKKMIKKEY